MFLNVCDFYVFVSYSSKCNVVFSIVILITCVFNLICAPLIVYEIDDWSDAMSTSLTILQSRIVAIAAFISRGFVLYNIQRDKNRKYKTTLESFDIYSPMSIVALNQCKLFSITVLVLCLTLILPFNLTKLYNLYNNHPDGFLITMYFSFFYLQNLSMCFMENHFVKQCFTVYKQFREINDGLRKIKTEHTDVNKFPFLGESRETTGRLQLNVIPARIIYDKDFYCPKDKDHPLANTVELLKIRHWLTREAVIDLNYLFGIHLGLSILSLSVLLLFDIYTDLFHYFTTPYDVTIFRSKLLFFGWILQYSFRFCMITITSNITIKQVK